MAMSKVVSWEISHGKFLEIYLEISINLLKDFFTLYVLIIIVKITSIFLV